MTDALALRRNFPAAARLSRWTAPDGWDHRRFDWVAERPVGGVVELVPVVTAPEERHPRLRQDTAYLRSLIDRRRPSDARMLLRGKPYLLGEYVRIGPNQTALTYAMNQDQDQGMLDVIAVLREAASERADKG